MIKKISDVLNLEYTVWFSNEPSSYIDANPGLNYLKRVVKIKKKIYGYFEYTFRKRLFYLSAIFAFFMSVTFDKSTYYFFGISQQPFLNIRFIAPFLTALAGIKEKGKK